MSFEKNDPSALATGMRRALMKRLRPVVNARKKGGAYQQELSCSLRAWTTAPNGQNLKTFMADLAWMFLGDHLSRAILADRLVQIKGAYTCDGKLYHFAPKACVESILSNGLLPKKRYVYLTDAPDALAGDYIPWKAAEIRRPTDFVLLEIDAARLSERQTIYRTDQPFELVTGKIDAQYITAAPGFGDLCALQARRKGSEDE